MKLNDRTKLIFALNHLAHLHDHIEGNYWEDYLRENIESMLSINGDTLKIESNQVYNDMMNRKYDANRNSVYFVRGD